MGDNYEYLIYLFYNEDAITYQFSLGFKVYIRLNKKLAPAKVSVTVVQRAIPHKIGTTCTHDYRPVATG
jgi:hypothetical protein